MPETRIVFSGSTPLKFQVNWPPFASTADILYQMSAYESIHALDATVPAFDLPMRPRNAYLRILI